MRHQINSQRISPRRRNYTRGTREFFAACKKIKFLSLSQRGSRSRHAEKIPFCGMSPLTNRKEEKRSKRRTRNALNASPLSSLSRATPQQIDTRSPGSSLCVNGLPLSVPPGNGGQERWSPWQLHPARECAERRRTVHRLHPLGWRARDPDLRTADEDDGKLGCVPHHRVERTWGSLTRINAAGSY